MSKVFDFMQNFVPTDEELNKPFYHYTTLPAFESILRTRQIWLSDAAFQNDAVEFKHGFDIAMKIMRSMAENADAKPTTRENINKLFKYLSERQNAPRVFIFSLTQKRDVLPHWSRYALSSQGICLGINLNALGRSQSSIPISSVPYKVIYDANTQEQAFVKLFTAAQDDLRENPNVEDKALSRLFSETIAVITYMCSFFKNDNFSDESEIRLVMASMISAPLMKEITRFHFRKEIMIPHVISQIGQNSVPMSEIFPEIILPMNADLNKDSLRVLCAMYDISQDSIKDSAVPFRS